MKHEHQKGFILRFKTSLTIWLMFSKLEQHEVSKLY